MRRLLLLGLLLTAGCQNVDGPFRRGPLAERVDDPRYSIQEQERRGRAGLALPDESVLAGPRSGAARPYFGTGRTFGDN